MVVYNITSAAHWDTNEIYTYVAIGAVIAFCTRAVVGINVIGTRGSIPTRTTSTFVDVCNQILQTTFNCTRWHGIYEVGKLQQNRKLYTPKPQETRQLRKIFDICDHREFKYNQIKGTYSL